MVFLWANSNVYFLLFIFHVIVFSLWAVVSAYGLSVLQNTFNIRSVQFVLFSSYCTVCVLWNEWMNEWILRFSNDVCACYTAIQCDGTGLPHFSDATSVNPRTGLFPYAATVPYYCLPGSRFEDGNTHAVVTCTGIGFWDWNRIVTSCRRTFLARRRNCYRNVVCLSVCHTRGPRRNGSTAYKHIVFTTQYVDHSVLEAKKS